jgi:hypothetical protein
MAFTTKKSRAEREQRVLACLVLNDGMITDDRGFGISRLARLMVGDGYTRDQVRASVDKLIVDGSVMVQRSNTSPRGITSRPHPGGNQYSRFEQRKAYVYAISLAKEKDELDLDPFYIEELRRQIEKRMVAKLKKAVPVVNPYQQTLPEPPKPARIESEYEPTTPEDKVADALLKRVVTILSTPVQVVDTSELELAKTASQRMATRISVLEGEVRARDHNIHVLSERVTELTAENERLKRAGSAIRERSGQLTSKIRDLVDDQTKAAMDELLKGGR